MDTKHCISKLEGFDVSENTMTITPKQLEDMLSRVLADSRKLNPMEQRKFDEEVERDRRRNMLMIELGKVEEEKDRRRKNGCSHKRDAKTGDAVSRDSMGEWTTGGQAYQDGTAAIICLRCSTTWIFKPTPEQYSIILQNGLLKARPPLEAVAAS